MKSQHRYCIMHMQWLCRSWRRDGFKVIHAKPNQPRRRREVFDNSDIQKKNQDPFVRTVLWNLRKASWNYERSTPHRSETEGIAEQAVRREGTSSVLVHSGLQESWWAEAVECYCFLRNVQDVRADSQTPNERRFNYPFEGPIIP